MGHRLVEDIATTSNTCGSRTSFGIRAVSLLATSVLIVFVTLSRAHAQDTMPPPARAELDAAYRAKASGDLEGAYQALLRARALGADRQQIDMELGYIELARGHVGAARADFQHAAQGPDRSIAQDARAQLRYLPSDIWADIYFETYGWYQLNDPNTANLVPMLRLRGAWRPILEIDWSLYIYGQITRDVSSRDGTPTSLPLIYADNYALLGGGMVLRLFERHVSVWAQIGPAFNLLDDDRPLVALDARVGVAAGIEMPECRPVAANGVRTMIGPCVEGYGEVVYVSRFDHDVVAMLRGRAGYGLLLTGPVLWQPLFELRALGGTNGDYYNNRAEAGIGHRWRLVEPFVIDLITTVHGGVYYGVENVDPVPDPPLFAELRMILATYAEVTP